MRTTEAVVEGNVLRGRDSGDLRLHGWNRQSHTFSAIEGAQVWDAACLLASVNVYGSEIRRWEGEQVQSKMHGGETVWILPHPATLVDFDGRFRMVRTMKRANADDRWAVVSPRDLFSAGIWSEHQLNSRAQEELEEKSILLCNVWRGLQLMFSRPTQIMILFRGGCTSSREDFMAHGTSDHCPGCRALVSGGRAQGRTEVCRTRIEGELRKTEEGKARLHAAATRVGDAPGACVEESSICGRPS